MTAQKWVLYDLQNDLALKGFKHKKQHDVASLSKILTFYTAYMIIKQYYLSLNKTELIVDEEDQTILGTKIPMKNESIVTL